MCETPPVAKTGMTRLACAGKYGGFGVSGPSEESAAFVCSGQFSQDRWEKDRTADQRSDSVRRETSMGFRWETRVLLSVDVQKLVRA